MQAVVPAAGEGTRLRPLTADRPKALVDVAGKPLLARVFDAVVPLEVDELVVVIGYQGGAIVDRFGEAYGGIPIRYVHQRERLGLGHAVAIAGPFLEGDFLVINGDNVTDAGLASVVETHREAHAAATVPLVEVSWEAARETGVVVVEDGRITSVVEKADEPPARLAMAGLQVCSPAVLDALESVEPSDRGEVELADALDHLARAGELVLPVAFPGWRLNVNTPADVTAAERHLA